MRSAPASSHQPAIFPLPIGEWRCSGCAPQSQPRPLPRQAANPRPRNRRPPTADAAAGNDDPIRPAPAAGAEANRRSTRPLTANYVPGQNSARLETDQGQPNYRALMGGDLHSTRNSRLTHDRTPNSAPPPAPHTAPDWKVGDRVLARFRTMNRGWYEAVIVAVNDGGTCYLKYDDGDSDEDVPSDKMKWPAPTVSPPV